MILWVRHGQSTWNALGRFQGRTPHPPLTDLGRRQAAAAADALAGCGVERLLSSPALRAWQTAEIIGDRLGLAAAVEPLLAEQARDESPAAVSCRLHRLISRDLPIPTVAVSHGDTIRIAVEVITGTLPRLPENGSVIRALPQPGELEITGPTIDPLLGPFLG